MRYFFCFSLSRVFGAISGAALIFALYPLAASPMLKLNVVGGGIGAAICILKFGWRGFFLGGLIGAFPCPLFILFLLLLPCDETTEKEGVVLTVWGFELGKNANQRQPANERDDDVSPPTRGSPKDDEFMP